MTINIANTASLKSSIWILILAVLFSSCAKDEDMGSSANEIISFSFHLTNNPISTNVVCTIDEAQKTISAIMPEGTDLTGLIPTIQIAEGATVTPSGAIDFTAPVIFTVTAENGDDNSYTANITAALSQRQVLQAILDANPDNLLDWDLPNTSNLGTLDGVTTHSNGKIIKLALDGQRLTRIPSEIRFLQNLQELNLAWNRIALDGFPDELSELSNLRLLNCNGCYITSIPPIIFRLTGLRDLGLSDNQISTIPNEISQLINLSTLHLESNELTGISPSINSIATLEGLYLAENAIRDIPSSIQNLKELKFLFLHDNKITNVPKEIGYLLKLERLGISNNPINSIAPEIGFLRRLQEINLFNTGFTNFPYSIKAMELFKNLKVIENNGVSRRYIETGQDGLITIFASNRWNSLEWAVDYYPEVEFNAQSQPRAISMNNKNLTRLPDEIGISYLRKLEVMHISQNRFGSLPSSLGYLNSLQILTLHGVNITTLPSTYGRLTNLVLLTLTGNPLSSIPDGVCNLQQSNGGILTILTDPGEGCQ